MKHLWKAMISWDGQFAKPKYFITNMCSISNAISILTAELSTGNPKIISIELLAVNVDDYSEE